MSAHGVVNCSSCHPEVCVLGAGCGRTVPGQAALLQCQVQGLYVRRLLCMTACSKQPQFDRGEQRVPGTLSAKERGEVRLLPHCRSAICSRSRPLSFLYTICRLSATSPMSAGTSAAPSTVLSAIVCSRVLVLLLLAAKKGGKMWNGVQVQWQHIKYIHISSVSSVEPFASVPWWSRKRHRLETYLVQVVRRTTGPRSALVLCSCLGASTGFAPASGPSSQSWGQSGLAELAFKDCCKVADAVLWYG